MREDVVGSRCRRDLGVSAASPAYAGPRYDYGPGVPSVSAHVSGPGGYPYWSGYLDAPVWKLVPPCHWITQRFWDGHLWLARRVRICG